MPSTNGHTLKQTILYARVSTDEQGRTGYSIPDQFRELRALAAREGHEIVEEIVDDGYSGGDPDRPGLKRILELADGKQIDLVLAAKRDRFFRSRLYRLLYERDLKERQVELRALNDVGHRIGDGLLDDFAEYEREEITRRTWAGKMQKARSGKIVAAYSPGYGYRYNEAKDGLVVCEEEMMVVRRIFELVAAGESIRAIIKRLNDEGVRGPRSVLYPEGRTGHGTWNRAMIRDHIIRNDLYLGILRFGRPDGLSGEEVEIAVLDAGLDPIVVKQARQAISENRRDSSAGRRTWPLSGGIASCTECGGVMSAKTTPGRSRLYYYYVCSKYLSEAAECSNNKSHRAPELEQKVWGWVSSFLKEPEIMRIGLERAIADRVGEDRGQRLVAERAVWINKLEEADTLRRGYQKQAAEGLMTLFELREVLGGLEAQRKRAQENLAALERRVEELEVLAQGAEDLLERLQEVVPEKIDALSPTGQYRVYRELGITVKVSAKREVMVESPLGAFCENESASPGASRPTAQRMALGVYRSRSADPATKRT